MNFKSYIFIITLLFILSFKIHAAGYTETKYPVVLVHGLFGYDDIIGIDYFYRIPQILRAGGTEVYVVKVSGANSSEERGLQLLRQVRYIRAKLPRGSKKVHLIGHSHGSPTIRFLAHHRPRWVASVTSIGGVNWGSKFADFMRNNFAPGSFLEHVIASIANSMTALIELLSGHVRLPTDSVKALESLTTEGSIKFNKTYNAGVPSTYCGDGDHIVNGVRYYSWSGTSPFTNAADPSSWFLSAICGLVFNEPNDGLVSACSSNLGKVIKNNYDMNHMDQVNQIFGIGHWWPWAVNPVNIYIDHIKRLKALGL